ncbi:MAG: type IV pilin N-terminal domain-containing protein [Thermoplasmata archaeon]
MRTRPRRNRRGISNIIGVILLVAITVVLAAVLFAFKPPVPTAASSIYYTVDTGTTAPTWGDLTDCANVNDPSTCAQQPAVNIVFTTQSPGTMAVADIEFYFICNGTVYFSSTLPNMLYIPTTNHAANFNCVGPNTNCLQTCGTYNPAVVFGYDIPFSRLGFFWQLTPNATYLSDGDSIVLYVHSTTAPHDVGSTNPDTDDYHGIPAWCFASPGTLNPPNNCEIKLVYLGQPQSTVVVIPISQLSAPN